MQAPTLTANQEAREDLYYGQLVIIIARWFLIAAGVVLALWSAKRVDDLIVPIAFMIALMALNFFVHGRYLMSQPLNATLVYSSVAVDLVVILAIVALWPAGQGTGLGSPFFVFLYPTLLAFALVFQPRISITFAAAAIAVFVLVVLLGSGVGIFARTDDLKDILRRVVTLGATAGLGAYFWRIQRRRRAGPAGRSALLDDVEALTRQPV